MNQLLLIDQPPDLVLRGMGHRRTVIGNMVQELVCRATSLEPAHIDGRKSFCPDATTPSGKPVEIKSVRVSRTGNGKAVLYDWRLKKEALLASDLVYVFFCHHGVGSQLTLATFLDRLVECPPTILIMPSLTVHRHARLCPLNVPKPTEGIQHNSRNGYRRGGYSDGYYNMPLQQFLTNANTPAPYTMSAGIESSHSS